MDVPPLWQLKVYIILGRVMQRLNFDQLGRKIQFGKAAQYIKFGVYRT
jgi:hypothetical protein